MQEQKRRPVVPEVAPTEAALQKPILKLPETEDITNQLKDAERKHEDLVSVCSFCYKEHCWIEPHILVHRSRANK